MKNYDVVLFDLDGTLTDPGEGITNSVIYSLKKYNIQIKDRSELYKFSGPPLHESYEKYFGFSKEEAKKAVEYYREYYKDTGIFENKLYDGIKELLCDLQNSGICLGVATSKPKVFAERILKYFDIAQYFSFIAGANLDGSKTKKEEVISDALDLCGVENRSLIVMVGDRKYDILGAKKFDIDSIGVLFGYGSKEELENSGATYIAEKVRDIFSIVTRDPIIVDK